MKPRIVFSFNSELFKVTGVQKVLMDIHHAIQDDFEARIVGTIPYGKIHKDLDVKPTEYVRWRNLFMFRNAIVILHERKYLALFWFLNFVLRQHIRLVYIHHNVFYNHRRMSVMPKTVVAISDEGGENLHKFFRVPMSHIHKIYNCVRDIHPQPHKPYKGGEVKILYPARINTVKRQTEIARNLKGKLSSQIKILFAGTGPEASTLQEMIQGDQHFEYLGYRTDIYNLLQQCDYILLFSQQEGLPITLIEATMVGTPAICNNVGGNPEIIHHKENGIILKENDWTGLTNTLNELQHKDEEAYKRMSSKGRDIYLNNFTFEKFKTQYMSLLNRI